MGTLTRNWLTAAMLGLLVACGGGGGGDRAAGVEPGPPPTGPVDPPPPVEPEPRPPAPYAEAEVLLATITNVDTDDDVRPMVWFQLTDGNGTAITDLAPNNVRFTIAKLQSSPLGNMTGTWQSYVNAIEPPDNWGVTDVGTEDRLQATYECGRNCNPDNFKNNMDGTYSYTFELSLNAIPENILAQAETEGLDLSFDAELPHRVAMQFDGNPNTTANPVYDWIPDTGATSGIMNMDIAATANCNNCHDPLGIHGSNRREVQYCVTCHNPGSTDAHSTNTVDMKVLIHKLHRGAGLPSVEEDGKEYYIIGYRGSKHDYSTLHYPQDIRNCVNCHVGSATVGDRTDLTVTSQGDNWAYVPSGAACESCHDAGWVPGHIASKEDTECIECHSAEGFAGSIEDSHRMLIEEAREEFAAEIISVDSTMRGEQAVVTFKIVNPQTGEAYDLKNDPAFNNPPVSRLAVDVAWDTDDYTNTGNEGDNASAVEVTDIASLVDNGDGSFSATMPVAIPDGSKAPGVAASGSGAAVIEGHPMKELDLEGNGELVASRIPLTNVHEFFSIDEADGEPDKRRVSVDIDNCNSCHATLSLHGNNRTDNIDSCVVCHNPRNTDKRVREVAQDPPTDGKDEESLDFKTMIHAIHAAGIREKALEVVGFRGFNTHRYNTDQVHYPGNLANCTACHTSDGYLLPLEDGVLGTTIDTGEDRADPSDDIVITPTAATCSGCHDDAVAKAHMETTGGASFSTTQQDIDDGLVVESCAVCHGEGHAFDVGQVHRPSDE